MRALVLCGGGTKGSYQAGAIKALNELNITFDIVTGTSIGALNGCLVAQNEQDRLYQLWDEIEMKHILADEIPDQYDVETIFKNKQKIESFLKSYVKEKGADITPFKALIKEYFNNDKLQASNIIFGCLSTSYPSLRPVYINKQMMKEHGEDYLLATASCFPIFPIHRFEGKAYIDGGYIDNLPIDYAIELGAKEVIAIDLSSDPNHDYYVEAANVTYIFPKVDLGLMMNFDRNLLNRNIRLGYLDVYKAFGKYQGIKYTFKPYQNLSFAKDTYSLMQKIDLSIIKNSIRSKEVVFAQLKEELHKKVLSYDDVIYGLMDHLMDLSDFAIEEVHDFETVAHKIVHEYAASYESDYELVPKKVIDVITYIKELDKQAMMEKLVHLTLFGDNKLINKNILYTLLPF
ncbi:MAG: patatin-like phospholipase family protein, partial [Erysipelotrichaceae bacterium]|nr:patatin-like phospholipase family protein [Erysipelotrichaceae bacterium]